MYAGPIPLCLLLFALFHSIREYWMHVPSEKESYSRYVVLGKMKLCLPLGKQIQLTT